MDPLEGWHARLRRGRWDDGNGEVSVLAHYCSVMRLLSGLDSSALLSLASGMQSCRFEGESVRKLRSHPQVQEFVRFLAGLEPIDQRTVWAAIGDECFPQLQANTSLFAQVATAPTLRLATDEVRSVAVPGQEILRTILMPEEGQTDSVESMSWHASPDEVLQVVLGMTFQEMADWQKEWSQNAMKGEGSYSQQEAVKSTEDDSKQKSSGTETKSPEKGLTESKQRASEASVPGKGLAKVEERKDGMHGPDEAPEGGQTGDPLPDTGLAPPASDPTGSLPDERKSERHKERRTRRTRSRSRKRSGGSKRSKRSGTGEDQKSQRKVDREQRASLPAGLTPEIVDEKQQKNQEMQDRLQADREAKREGAGKRKLKRMDQDENRWHNPRPDASCRPDVTVQSLESEKTKREGQIPGDDRTEKDKIGQEGEHESDVARKEEQPEETGSQQKVPSMASHGAGGSEIGTGAAPDIPIPERPKRENSYTLTEVSDRTVEFDEWQLENPRRTSHGWDQPYPAVVYWPSGAMSDGLTLVQGRLVPPSCVANVVVLRPTWSGVDMNMVQVGFNALDDLVRRAGGGSVAPERVHHVEQVEGKQMCSRTGLPKSRLKQDWSCPTKKCVNSVKLVFGKRSRCPLCGAAKPGQVIEQSVPAMEAKMTRPRSPIPEDGSHKQRRLLESIVAKQKAAQAHGEEKDQTSDKDEEASNESYEVPAGPPRPKARPIFGQG